MGYMALYNWHQTVFGHFGVTIKKSGSSLCASGSASALAEPLAHDPGLHERREKPTAHRLVLGIFWVDVHRNNIALYDGLRD
jgi:hypothetical protein